MEYLNTLLNKINEKIPSADKASKPNSTQEHLIKRNDPNKFSYVSKEYYESICIIKNTTSNEASPTFVCHIFKPNTKEEINFTTTLKENKWGFKFHINENLNELDPYHFISSYLKVLVEEKCSGDKKPTHYGFPNGYSLRKQKPSSNRESHSRYDEALELEITTKAFNKTAMSFMYMNMVYKDTKNALLLKKFGREIKDHKDWQAKF